MVGAEGRESADRRARCTPSRGRVPRALGQQGGQSAARLRGCDTACGRSAVRQPLLMLQDVGATFGPAEGERRAVGGDASVERPRHMHGVDASAALSGIHVPRRAHLGRCARANRARPGVVHGRGVAGMACGGAASGVLHGDSRRTRSRQYGRARSGTVWSRFSMAARVLSESRSTPNAPVPTPWARCAS